MNKHNRFCLPGQIRVWNVSCVVINEYRILYCTLSHRSLINMIGSADQDNYAPSHWLLINRIISQLIWAIPLTRVLPKRSSCLTQSSTRGLIGPTYRELAIVCMLILLSSSITCTSSVPPSINTSFKSLNGNTANSNVFQLSSTWTSEQGNN